MPKCTIDGSQIEVEAGTTVIEAAGRLGIEIPRFCYHPDLTVDGNCRMCLVEIEKLPKLQIACNTAVTAGMVVHTRTEQVLQARRTTLEFLLANHPIDCPVCDQAGECYLQDQYMAHGLHESRVEIEEKVHKRKLVDLGPIMLDAERCVLCSRCLRFEREVTRTNSLEFRNRGCHTEIGTFLDRPLTHQYAGNLADVCPVGALLSHDFRFKMRVWFLEPTPSVCPGCSTGCNVFIDHRDGEAYRLRPRRNVDVNRSWMCDPGRALYREIGSPTRLAGARLGRGSRSPVPLAEALGAVAERIAGAADRIAWVATPQATNEDLFALGRLWEARGGLLDFRVGDPQDRLHERLDQILQRADRNPNTQGCLDLEMGRSGVARILEACRSGRVGVLLLQGPELLRDGRAAEPLRTVPFVAVMATHEGPELDRADAVLPAAMWAEVDGTFTNHGRRVQRLHAAFPPPGEARPRWALAEDLLRRLGAPMGVRSERELFHHLAGSVAEYASLDHQTLGATGSVVPRREGEGGS